MISNFNYNFKNRWSNGRKNVVNSVCTPVLTFYRILSRPDFVDVFIVSIWSLNRP
jgi:hypothetical protein